MATTFAKGLFGVDPAEYSMQQQKLWSNLYAQASSPYEKMGLALAQIGGTALGLNETAVDKKIADISKVLNDIGTQYQVGTAEYYKAVADALPAQYPDAKAQAQAEYIKFKEKETEIFDKAKDSVRKDPESVDVYVNPLIANIAKKAKEILLEVCRNVYTTKGTITDRLREDWGLTDIMKELNFEKYKLCGLTYEETGKNGERLQKIKNYP